MIDKLLDEAIAEGDFPGACYAFGKLGGNHSSGCRGRFTYCPESPETKPNTLWDLASVSKVVGTTTMAMLLLERGLLKLDQPVADVLSAFRQKNVTTRNLLVHDSGFIAFRPYQKTCASRDEVWDAICKEPLSYATGSKTVYSDLNMITLQVMLEHLAAQPMDLFLQRNVWEPLQMADTLYNPGIGNPRCAPTDAVEPWRMNLRTLRKTQVNVADQFPDAAHWIQGEVHDPNALVFGGVAGHAGLFSTTPDLTRFSHLMLKEGDSLLKPTTIRQFMSKQSDRSSRALGWDTKSPTGSSAGSRFGPRSYGHTGYTGTSIWIDPDASAYAILLTNRVHPTSENTKIVAFRPKFHDAVAGELDLPG